MLTNDDFWDLLTERTTLVDLEHRHRLASARAIIRDELEKLSTRSMLNLRRWYAGFDGFDQMPLNLRQLPGIEEEFYGVLREVLATREHIWRGSAAKEHRRKMAQMHHGSKKLKRRY